MKKKWIKFSSIGLAIALTVALLVAFVPNGSKMFVTSEGRLSVDMSIALAANIPPDVQFTEAGYQVGDEVIEKRTRNSKTHWLGGEGYSWDGTIGSIHYEDSGWQEIDSYFEPAVAPWDWQMLKAGYHIRVKEDFTAGQIIEFEKQGETVQFQPMALEWTNDLDQIQPIAMPHEVTPVITNPEVDLLPAVGILSHQGTIRWNDGYGEGINFEWKCSSTRLIKILEIESLNKLPAPEQSILDGGNPVLRLNLMFDPPRKQDVDIYVDGEVWNRVAKKQTFNVIEFCKDGEVLWGFMPLRYWGSGEAEDNEGQSVATLEKRGNKLYISIRVPHNWLQTVVYPAFIDTDVNEQVGAVDDDAKEDVGDGTTMTDGSVYWLGYSYQDEHVGVRFQTVAVPQGATIVTAYTQFYAYISDSGNVNFTWYGEDIDDAPAFVHGYQNFNISGRDRTAASVNENPPEAWTNNTWEPDTNIEIKTIIKEIVDRGGWASGQDMVIINFYGSGYGERGFDSWAGDSSKAAKLHIEYSAACSPDISNTPSSKDFGAVATSSTPTTGLTHFTVTNSSGGAVTITIKAIDWTGGNGWTHSDTATPGSDTAGLKAGLEGADYTIIVKKTAAYNTLVAGLADSGTQKWGLKLYTPTSFTDGVQKTTTVTLTAACD